MLQMFVSWLNTVLPRDEEGQGMVEYGIMIAVVALVVILGLGVLGTNLSDAFIQLGAWMTAHITT